MSYFNLKEFIVGVANFIIQNNLVLSTEMTFRSEEG